MVDTIAVPGQTSNCAWGNEDKQTLYVTSGNDVYKIRNAIGTTNIDNTESGSQLLVNYPNPFHESTNIHFYLKQAQQVRIDIFNTKGEKITTLVDTNFTSGMHKSVWNTSEIEVGIYYVRLACNGSRDVKCCSVLKM